MELLRVPNSPGGGGKHLTDEQLNRLLPGIVRLYTQGWPVDVEMPKGIKEPEVPLTLRQIGVLVNRDFTSIRNYLLKAGVRLRRRGRRPVNLHEIGWFTDEYYMSWLTDSDLQFAALNLIRRNRYKKEN